jgi:hypothetical protein
MPKLAIHFQSSRTQTIDSLQQLSEHSSNGTHTMLVQTSASNHQAVSFPALTGVETSNMTHVTFPTPDNNVPHTTASSLIQNQVNCLASAPATSFKRPDGPQSLTGLSVTDDRGSILTINVAHCISSTSNVDLIIAAVNSVLEPFCVRDKSTDSLRSWE